MVAAMMQASNYKLDQEMLEACDSQIWMDARSLPEYENVGIYLARMRALVAHR